MAEGLFKVYLKGRNRDDITAESAGLYAGFGHPASPNAVLAAKDCGAGISGHRSRPVSENMLTEAHAVAALGRAHYDILSESGYGGKLFLLSGGVCDPFGGDIGDYRACAEKIRGGFDALYNEKLALDIIPMGESHVKDAAMIENACFSRPWSETALSDALKKHENRYFVALYENKTAGYIGADNISGEVYITNFAVSERFRRKGIGEKLLKTLIKKSEEEKAAFITLEVRPSNAPAAALYKKLGFEIAGERKGFYAEPAEDAYIMTKELRVEN